MNAAQAGVRSLLPSAGLLCLPETHSLFGLLRPDLPPKFVCTSEGQMQMTRMPCGRSSACQHWLMPRTAHLLAE